MRSYFSVYSRNIKIYLLVTHCMGISVKKKFKKRAFVYLQFQMMLVMCGKAVNANRLTQ